jgi:hypothetical protein
LAREWRRALDKGEYQSLADLALYLKVTRARVTQIMNLLSFEPEIQKMIIALGQNLSSQAVSERTLRPLLRLPVEKQKLGINRILSKKVP